MEDGKKLLTARMVRERFGNVSDMALWRWLNDPKMNFPRPIVINRLRYWEAAEIDAWLARHREAV